MSNATENGDEPAYPSVEKNDWHGLTKRESMAMQIMAGVQFCPDMNRHDMARIAVSRADALLAELARTEG